MVTHTSRLSSQMDVMLHSTVQLLSPVQLVGSKSQNLHSLGIFMMEDSRKEKKNGKISSVKQEENGSTQLIKLSWNQASTIRTFWDFLFSPKKNAPSR